MVHSPFGQMVAVLAASYLLLLGADWSSCQSDLDTLRRRASDASDQASNVESASEEMESKRREFEDCRLFPGIYDIWKDGCSSQADQSRNARSRLESAKSDLESALDDVDSALRSVSASCDFSFSSSPVVGVQRGSDRLCRLLQRYKGQLPTEKLLETCRKAGRSEEQCTACLQ